MEAKSSLHLGVALFRQYFSASACECGVCGVHEELVLSQHPCVSVYVYMRC